MTEHFKNSNELNSENVKIRILTYGIQIFEGLDMPACNVGLFSGVLKQFWLDGLPDAISTQLGISGS